jgi:cytoskeletal protein CcmA (bactofilin family)
MKVDNLLSIKASAKIEGDIETSKIGIEIGAEFKGVCNYVSNKEETPIAKQVKMDKSDNQLVY